MFQFSRKAHLPKLPPMLRPRLFQSTMMRMNHKLFPKSVVLMNWVDPMFTFPMNRVFSTPTSSQPASPQIRHQEGDRDVEDEQQQQQQQQPREGTSAQEAEVEIEIENTLTKKEIVQDLKHIKSGYTIGSYVSGLSLTIAVVGLFGDFYLL